jgi:ribosomal protein S18 acetylase RimI-like enzyme
MNIIFMKISILKEQDFTKFSKFSKKSIFSVKKYYSKKACLEEAKLFSVSSLKNRFADKKDLIICSKFGEKIVGFISGQLSCGVFWLEWVAVHPKFRRKKIAEDLYSFFEKKAKLLGAHKIWCDNRVCNKESISLIKKLGFRRICIIKNHWYNMDYNLWQKEI